MSQVIAFPRSPAAVMRPARFAVVNPRREYSFAEVVRLLTLRGETRTQIGYLRDLARQCGMPLPKNPRRWGGVLQQGAAMIGSGSRWCALEFDAWLDGRRNPPPAAMADDVPPLPPLARADMAARARMLASR